MMKRAYLFISILLFNFIFSQAVLSMGDGTVNAGETVVISTNLSNDENISGFEIRIVDWPNYLTVSNAELDVSTTSRTPGFTLVGNEQEDGSFIILGFDIGGGIIEPGTGSIVDITFTSTSQYSTEIQLSILPEASVLSDPNASAVDFDVETGLVTVVGEDPPPLFAPENLVTVGGWEMMNLSWSHPEPWTVTGYSVFRDGVFLGTSEFTNFADSGLDINTQYCYTVSAYNDFIESDVSNESCGSTLDLYLEEPGDLTASENGLEIFLDWNPPGLGEYTMFVGGGSWESEVSWDLQYEGQSVANGAVGQYDLLLAPGDYTIFMFDSYGDGWNGNIYEITDSNGNIVASGTLDTGSEGQEQFNLGGLARELLGFEIYRDNQGIEFTTESQYVDNQGLNYLVEYCYNIVAVYDEGSSGYSNTACATPQLSEPSNLSAEGQGDHIYLMWDPHSDNAQQSFNIYRDGEYLDNTSDTMFSDFTAIHDVEYCYTVRAVYEEGESPDSNEDCAMWMILPPSDLEANAGDGYVDLSWGLPDPNTDADMVGTWSLTYDWYCTGVPAGPGTATFYEDGTGEVDGFPVVWGGANTVELGDGLCSGIGEFEYNAYFQFEGYAVYYYFNIDGDYGEGWQDDNGYNGENVDGITTITRIGARDAALFSANSIDLNGVNPISPFPNPQMVDSNINTSRELLSWNIYRDNNLVGNVPSEEFTYRDEPLDNMTEYCYSLTGVYEEGESPQTELVCATPIPGIAPTNLTASDMGGTISLEWQASNDPNLIQYNVYKDGQILGSTNDTTFDDSEVIAGVEYCYEVKAEYPSGESFPTNQACSTYVLNPPVGVSAIGMDDEQYIHVSWNAPGSLRELTVEVLTDTWPTETSWTLVSSDGTVIESVESGSLTEGGVLYQWSYLIAPGLYTFTIFDTWGDGILDPGYYSLFVDGELAVSGGGSGGFTNEESTTFDTDDFSLTTIITDPNPTRLNNSLTNTKNYDQQLNVDQDNPELIVMRSIENINRDLLYYEVFRDDQFLAQVDIGTYEYLDYETEHDIIYCYYIKAVYDEGNSVPSNEACDQWILQPASELSVLPIDGALELTWLAADSDVIDYTIYRDGEAIANTTETTYVDNTSEHDVLYCYTVTANYDLGESGPTNEDCAMWMILPPAGLTAEAGDGFVHLEWFEPATDLCGNYQIPSLPYTHQGSNIGAGDDWLVQGSSGADVAYYLYLPTATNITVSVCSQNTDYDTKLEIFTADFDCFETTTGYYNDDFTCNDAPVGSLASTLDPVSLSAGSYYIVVDGFGGQEGNYEITVSESNWEVGDCVAEAPYDDDCYEQVISQDPFCCDSTWDELCEQAYQTCMGGDNYSNNERILLENIAHESNKANQEISIDEWKNNMAINTNINRDLMSYNIYRNGNYLDNVSSDTYEYDDFTVENMNEYCYTLTGIYEDGESPESNIACATPIPGDAPTQLDVSGGEGFVLLEWSPGSNGVIDYNIYRDGTYLSSTSELTFQDVTAIHDVEYCYQVTANYPSGESFPSNEDCGMWMILPPSDVTAIAGDGYIDLSWGAPDPSIDGDLVGTWSLTYDWYCTGVPAGPGTATFYEDGTGDVDGFPVVWGGGSTIELGDGLCSGVGEFDYNAYFQFEGYAVYYYFNIDGDYGEGWQDDNGYNGENVDGITTITRLGAREADLRSNNVVDLNGINPISPFSNPEMIETNERENRELLSWNIYRDNSLIANVPADEFSYRDEPLTNMVEYCYNITGLYAEGESPQTENVCETPIPGVAPFNLSAIGGAGFVGLTWEGGDPIEYIVYRDGVNIGSTTNMYYEDITAVHDVEYCYQVTGLYASGESFPTNESCGMWILGPPVGLSSEAGNGYIELCWNAPGSQRNLEIEVFTDNYPTETSFTLESSDGTVISSVAGGELTSSETLYEWEYMVNPGQYTFSIFDSFGDGICCGYGYGYYNILIDGVIVASGGEFADSEIVEFNTEGALLSTLSSSATENAILDKELWYENNMPNVLESIEHTDDVIVMNSIESIIDRDLLQYNIYRDDQFLTSVPANESCYLDDGLENGTQYCYFVVAEYDEGESQPSNEICDAPDAGPMCPPEDFVAIAEDGSVTVELDWNPPLANCGTLNISNEENISRDFIGYNVYRDNELLLFTENTEYEDIEIQFGVEYCYKVKSLYDDGESNPTETLCVTVIDPANFAVLAIESADVSSGSDITLSIPLNNPIDVAGFQFTLTDSPDALTSIDVLTTDRTETFIISFNEQPNGSVIIVGFDVGGGVIEAGDGSIVDIVYSVEDVFSQTQVNLTMSDIFLGATDASELPVFSMDGYVNITPAGAALLGVESAMIDLNDSGAIAITLDNEDDVYGFQFAIEDNPNIISYVDIVATDRTNGWAISAQENDDNIVTVVGFDFSGGTIAPGNGPIAILTFNGDIEGQTSVSIYDPILSADNGVPMPVATSSGTVDVGGEAPIFGCTDPEAINYNPDATEDDGTCEYTVMQSVTLNSFMLNSVSFNVLPDDLSIESNLEDIPVLLMSDDNGGFYAPSFGVNQLGDLSLEGYRCFISGSSDYTVSVEGTPVDQTTPLLIEAFKLNLLPYLPQMEMSSDDVFGDYYDNILLISNDMGQFNAPSFGVYQITTMSPGEAYSIFLSGASDVDFSYPGEGFSRFTDMSHHDDLYNASIADHYDFVKTGISHPIILTSLNGMVEAGDEIAAYANGEVVGATKVVDPNGVTVIAAWGGYNQYGIELPGYTDGDAIELRVWKHTTGEELYVTADLDGLYYGETPLTSGSATVHDMSAVPMDFVLNQNYPNPFNPSTQIEYSMPESGQVTLSIYDVSGRLVQTLVDGVVASGYHTVTWNGKDSAGHTVSAGLYIYSLKSDQVTVTRKMVMMK